MGATGRSRASKVAIAVAVAVTVAFLGVVTCRSDPPPGAPVVIDATLEIGS